MDTERKRRDSASARDWIAGAVVVLLSVLFGAWLQSTNAKVDRVLEKLGEVKTAVSSIKTKVERNERDIERLAP